MTLRTRRSAWWLFAAVWWAWCLKMMVTWALRAATPRLDPVSVLIDVAVVVGPPALAALILRPRL